MGGEERGDPLILLVGVPGGLGCRTSQLADRRLHVVLGALRVAVQAGGLAGGHGPAPLGGQVAGQSVKEIAANESFPSQCVFIAIYAEEKGELSIPHGEQVIHEGDELFLISTAENIRKVAKVHAHQRTSQLAETGLGSARHLDARSQVAAAVFQ